MGVIIPRGPGAYGHFDAEGKALYIGSNGGNVLFRSGQHFNGSCSRGQHRRETHQEHQDRVKDTAYTVIRPTTTLLEAKQAELQWKIEEGLPDLYKGPGEGTASVFTGVCWAKTRRKWKSSAHVELIPGEGLTDRNTLTKHLGLYPTALEAARARDEWVFAHPESGATRIYNDPKFWELDHPTRPANSNEKEELNAAA